MKTSSLFLFFLLAFLISWIVVAPLYLPHFGITGLPVLPNHHAYAALGPITAAFIVTALDGGKKGVVDLLARMVRWNVKSIWYIVAFLVPFIILGFSLVIVDYTKGVNQELEEILQSRDMPEMSLLAFFLYSLFTFGYGEEVGWRGVALEKLQSRMHPLLATLLLTVVWALWHIPYFLYRPIYSAMDIFDITGWFFSLLTGSILLSWLYNSSGNSLLITAIFHSTINMVFTSQVASPEVSYYVGLLVSLFGIIVLIATGFRLGRPNSKKNNHQERIEGKVFKTIEVS